MNITRTQAGVWVHTVDQELLHFGKEGRKSIRHLRLYPAESTEKGVSGLALVSTAAALRGAFLGAGVSGRWMSLQFFSSGRACGWAGLGWFGGWLFLSWTIT